VSSLAAAGDVVFDPYDYATQEDPYPSYAWLRENAPLNPLDKATMYGGGAKGYTDYPALA